MNHEPVKEEQSRNTSTILVVDDLPENLELIVTHLKQAGYKMLIASSGEMALQRIYYVKPDLILLDIMMPGLTGWKPVNA